MFDVLDFKCRVRQKKMNHFDIWKTKQSLGFLFYIRVRVFFVIALYVINVPREKFSSPYKLVFWRFFTFLDFFSNKKLNSEEKPLQFKQVFFVKKNVLQKK